MRIPHAALPALRTAVLLAFVATMAWILGYFWIGAGGTLPLVSGDPYRVSTEVPRVNNLVPQSNVTMAGVIVGSVESIEPVDNVARVTVIMNKKPEVAPLHEGVTGRILSKTLVEETYLDLADGQGPEIADGGTVPREAITPPVSVDDVVRALPEQDRAALSSAVQSLAAGTQDGQAGLAGALSGLGQLSREGRDAVSALADQSASLTELSNNTASVLDALDTRQGQIAQLVTDANDVTAATAGSADDIEAVVTRLPGTLSTARDAGDDLSRLGGGLQPVASNLNRAAPSLNAALQQLPGATSDLRGLLPALDTTLDRAPTTLQRVPQVSEDLVNLIPKADQALANLNPMLSYLEPYGPDVATFFTNFGQTLASGDGNGDIFRVMPVFNEQSVKGFPVPSNGLLDRQNPYQAPGQQQEDPSGDEREAPPLAPLSTGGN